MTTFEKKLKENFHDFHRIIRENFARIWKSEISGKKIDEKVLRAAFSVPNAILLCYWKKFGLYPGSAGGTYLEWTFFHFLSEGIKALKKESVAVVKNRHQIPFPWKKRKKGKRKSQLNLDLAIKPRGEKSTKLFYAFELKTNLDDNFKKYREEEKLVFHHRQKSFRRFKYYFVCLNPQGENSFRTDINTLKRRGEIFCLNKSTGIPGVKELVATVRRDIQKIN